MDTSSSLSHPTPQVINPSAAFDTTLKKINQHDKVSVYRLTLRRDQPIRPEPLTIRWSLPAHNAQGVWSTNALYDKRLRADSD